MLTVHEVARALRLNPATVRAHAAEWGGVQFGRQWRFPPDVAAPTLQSGRRGDYSHKTTDRIR